MPGPFETIAVRDVARSVARDLVRLVRAVEESAGLDALSGLQRAQLDAVRRALVKITSEMPKEDRPVIGEEVLRVKAYLGATRSGILAELTSQQRVRVLEALLAVEVADGEVKAVLSPGRRGARRTPADSSPRRVAARLRGEARRRHEESRSLPVAAGVAEHFARLPRSWREGIWRSAGFAGRPRPEAMARYLLGPDTLSALVDSLQPMERAALAIIMRSGGMALARVIEERFGDSTADGWDWDREPPTSVLGRLRLNGLCTVGRMAVPGNARSRPRVALVPCDLRQPLARALAEHQPEPPRSPAVPGHIVQEVMGEEEPPTGEPPFDHAQPELHQLLSMLAARLSPRVKPAVLLTLTSGIWRAFERAHPGRVPRARVSDVEAARTAALGDLAAVETTHLRVLQRRVVRMLSAQPHIYAYVANFLELSRWQEGDKLIVYHACDVTLRALHDLICIE